MAKLKMLKYPRKPKAGASVATKEKWLKRKAEIDRENNRRKALNRKSDALTKRIAGISRTSY